MYDDIILVLRDGWGDAQFRYWVQKHFMLVKIGEIHVVYSNGKVSRPVVTYEELYTKLNECHKRVGHHGRDKTWEEVHKSIISVGYLTRIHMDLIDMRCRPDDKFKWILHVKDHFSRFSWAYPLESKEPELVAEKLLNQFYSFGAPRILQSDNEKEFVARVIRDMKKTWVDLVILNGRIRHPQTHGLIERSNRTLGMVLYKWMQHNHTDNWSAGLGPVVYSINTSVAKVTNKTPFEIVFGQRPRSDFETWKMISESGVEDEENLPNDFIYEVNELHQCNMINNETNDLNDIDNNNQLNIFDTSNQILDPTCQLQSLASSSTQNINNAVSTLDKTRDETNITCPPHNLFDFYDNATAQDILVTNNSENIPSTTDDTVNHRHKKIRDETKADYMKSIAKRQKLYDNAIKKQQYELGDLVGLQVDHVDRTNTTSKILPCKVISVHSSLNDSMMYKVCTLKGVLSTVYGVRDILDLRKCDFTDLRDVDPTTLPIITFTEACKEYVTVGINPVTEACNCNGKCATKSCPCKAKHVKCCTKCHPQKKHTCANICDQYNY
ncbi:unnamed protein product [Rotaria sordida]|uniref:Integrase catalytic domain-containing protein n=1 Tax=Rotaria sordida TaxID=392033 RepID=A0A815WLE9_9BILA|nr:unnamed protein product [Rotaria sordida]CAF1546838.1 unnamed protein product [Rotaria sordida]